MFRSRKLKFLLLLLFVELILIETNINSLSNKRQKPIKKIQRQINVMVKLFRIKLDRDELYSDDLLGFACLVLKIIQMRNQSLTPEVYWYSRKGQNNKKKFFKSITWRSLFENAFKLLFDTSRTRLARLILKTS